MTVCSTIQNFIPILNFYYSIEDSAHPAFGQCGLFATQKFRLGDVVGEYTGKVLLSLSGGFGDLLDPIFANFGAYLSNTEALICQVMPGEHGGDYVTRLWDTGEETDYWRPGVDAEKVRANDTDTHAPRIFGSRLGMPRQPRRRTLAQITPARSPPPARFPTRSPKQLSGEGADGQRAAHVQRLPRRPRHGGALCGLPRDEESRFPKSRGLISCGAPSRCTSVRVGKGALFAGRGR